MSSTSNGEANTGLDPIVLAALSDLTSLVYDSHVSSYLRPRQLTTHFHLDGPSSTGRAAGVAMFKTLKHFGVEWDTGALCDWVTRRGWAAKDIVLLREFGDGIQSGTRFHTGPVPWARSQMEAWGRGESFRRMPRKLKMKSCCRKEAEPPLTRAEKLAKSSAPFTRD
jgi:hypothetical protein